MSIEEARAMRLDLKDWYLVITESGKAWVGKVDLAEQSEAYRSSFNEGRVDILLTDALSVITQFVQMPNGQQGFMRSFWPIEIAHGIQDMPVDEIEVWAAVKPQRLSELPTGAAAEIAKSIEAALGMREQARAARAGIVLAGAMPRPS